MHSNEPPKQDIQPDDDKQDSHGIKGIRFKSKIPDEVRVKTIHRQKPNQRALIHARHRSVNSLLTWSSSREEINSASIRAMEAP